MPDYPEHGLQQHIKLLLSQARDNERKYRRFQLIEMELIAADTLYDLFHILLVDYPKLFALDACRLLLNDSHKSIGRLFDERVKEAPFFERISLYNSEQQCGMSEQIGKRPTLGTYNRFTHSWIFTGDNGMRSMAILPLVRHGETIGALCFGSSDKQRFEPSHGTDFLEHLAAITTVCLENAVNSEKLKLSLIMDPLTQVKNRRCFDQRLQEEVARAQRTQSPLACAFIDVDHFKQVNDTHGHQIGDEVLVSMAHRAEGALRNHDLLARYGGEEFSVLLPDTTLDDALIVAERILQSVNCRPVNCKECQVVPVTVSIGVACFIPQGDTNEDVHRLGDLLVEKSDVALYQAKHQGRNQVVSGGLVISQAYDDSGTLAG